MPLHLMEQALWPVRTRLMPLPCGGVWISAGDAFDSLALMCHCLCTGKYTASDGEAECVACGAGKYAAQMGVTVCVDCAAGKHLASTGNADCVACAAGADACPAVL